MLQVKHSSQLGLKTGDAIKVVLVEVDDQGLMKIARRGGKVMRSGSRNDVVDSDERIRE